MVDRAPLTSNLIPRKGTAAQDMSAVVEPQPQISATREPLSSGEGATVPEPASPPPTNVAMAAPVEPYDDPIAPRPQAPFRRSLTYRPTVETHNRLRDLSHRTGHSIQDLIDEALNRFLNGHKRR